jgi:DNA invertase Pin-like site-specific DNA recombinase
MPDMLGYARVSTHGQDLEVQRRRLRDEARVVRLFEDVISGKEMNRPGLAALLDYARQGDALVIVRLDRLGRSLRELLDVVETLKARGIALISLEEKIDTSSAAGELIFHVFGSIAHFERRLIAERTRDGIAAARAAGRKPGRPGLDPRKLQSAITLIRSGLSPSLAAKQVGVGRSTLYREISLILPEIPGLRQSTEISHQSS